MLKCMGMKSKALPEDFAAAGSAVVASSNVIIRRGPCDKPISEVKPASLAKTLKYESCTELVRMVKCLRCRRLEALA